MTYPRTRAGFTLIEVLAVLFLTALVLGVALDFYVDLSNQSAHAAETTREVRGAASLLDRIASDFERVLLVRKPEETDPLAHPWVFVAEARGADGADRVKFIERRSETRRNDLPGSELEQVAYLLREPLEPDPDTAGLELVRWSYPGLPEGLDREFPLPDDPNALVLARGVTRFALLFLHENGDWLPGWDSSQLLESSELPLAIDIEVGFATEDEDAGFDEEPPVYHRRVLLPVRPLDLETLLDPEAYAASGDGQGEDELEEDDNCASFTVGDCVDPSLLSGGSGQLQNFGGNLQQLRDTSWCAFKALYKNHPAVRPECR